MPRGCPFPSHLRDVGTLKNELEILIMNKELETDFVPLKLDDKLTWELTSEGGGGRQNNLYVRGTWSTIGFCDLLHTSLLWVRDQLLSESRRAQTYSDTP